MATPVSPVSTTPPVSVALSGGTVSEILVILSAALNVLSAIPATAAGAALAQVVIGVITASVSRIQSQTGQPIDLTKIPQELPLP